MRTVFSIIFILATFAPHVVKAGSCDVVYNAGIKTVQTPHRVFSTMTRGGKTTSSESVFVDGVEYRQRDGRWQRSLMTAKEMLDNAKEKLTAPPDTCIAAPDEMIGGRAVAVYRVRNTEMESESLVRVFKDTGLLQGQTAGFSSE